MNQKIRIASLLVAGVAVGSGSGVMAKTTTAFHYRTDHATIRTLDARAGNSKKRTIADADPKPEDPKPETPAADQPTPDAPAAETPVKGDPAPDAPAGDNTTSEADTAPEAVTGTIEIQAKDEKVVETLADGKIEAVISDNDGKKLDVIDVGADGAIKETPYQDGASKPPVDEGNVNTLDENKIEADAAQTADAVAPENPVASTLPGVEVKALLSTLPAVTNVDPDVKTSVQTEESEPADETGRTTMEVDISTDAAGVVTTQAFAGEDRKPEGEIIMSALTPNPDTADTDHPMTREITYKDFSGAHYNGKVVESLDPKTGDVKLTTDNLTSNLNGADQTYAFTITGDKKAPAKAARTGNSHDAEHALPMPLAHGAPPPPDPRPAPVFVQHHNYPSPITLSPLHVSSTNFQITEHPQPNSHDAAYAKPRPLYHGTVQVYIRPSPVMAQHHK